MNQVLLLTLAFFGFTSVAVADLPIKPKLSGYTTAKSPASSKIGNISVCLDDTTVYTIKGKTKLSATPNLTLNNHQLIKSGPSSRCLIQLTNGDRLTLGNDALVQINQQEHMVLQLWYGSLIVDIQSTTHWQVNMTQGTATLSQGLYALKSRHNNEADIVAYNQRAQWQAQNPHTLTKRHILKSRDHEVTITPLSTALKQTIRRRLSPERLYLSSTLKIFNDNQTHKAKQQLAILQSAYPNNSDSAYYLGTIALKEGNHAETISQWQRFIDLDPSNAEARDILRNLTVIKQKEADKQIKKLIGNPSLYSKAPAQPGTIAVLPFANQGDKEYNIISKGITAMVITDLSKIPGLKVLEREKVQKLMDELKLSQSGLVDKETSLEAGKLMRAEKVIEGSFAIEK